MTRVTIVGAGLAGALVACYLGRRGMRVEVYERRPDPRRAGFIGGRSINLALSTRGLDALGRVGLAEKVLADAIPMPGRMMHDRAGDLTFQPYGRSRAEAINSVSRGGLNIALLDAADACENVTLHFDHRCTAVDLDAPAATFVLPDGAEREARGDVVIGADGAFSAVRGAMQINDRFTYSQTYLEHGYKELCIPPREDGDFAMEPGALHIWPRGGSMMIALPNGDRTFTCTLFWPFEEPNGFARLTSDEAVLDRFRRDYRDTIPLMPTLLEDFRTNPVSSLVTIRCAPWHRGKSVVIGDAAHAIVPFYGQGMNAAFEDCALLDALIDAHGADWDRILPAFSAQRKADADAIADLAMENFVEMRDRVGSRLFVLRKRLEKRAHALFPRWYVPLYNMVSFTTIPYAEARRRGRRQDRILAMILLAASCLLVLLIALLLIAAVP